MVTEQESIDQLDAMTDGSDAEIEHENAEQILLLYLDAIGRGDLVHAFESARDRVGFWYA